MTKSWDYHQFFYTDYIPVPLPEKHRFPMAKYRRLREELLRVNLLDSIQLHESPLCSIEDLLLVHDKNYVEGIQYNTLDIKQARPIGLPLSEGLFRRSLASVGGFIQATFAAYKTGFSAQLAGGTHHAFADRGEGFCVFNDFAVAGVKLLKEGLASRILILDLDVHQGNGTSSILGARDDFYIVSFHGERNYPFRKIPSHLDIAFPEGVRDEVYLTKLQQVLSELKQQKFDFIFYQAGVDVLEHDSLGSFKLSFEGVIQRDRMVFQWARDLKVPLAMGIGGGYSVPISHTIDAHVGTFRAAKEFFG